MKPAHRLLMVVLVLGATGAALWLAQTEPWSGDAARTRAPTGDRQGATSAERSSGEGSRSRAIETSPFAGADDGIQLAPLYASLPPAIGGSLKGSEPSVDRAGTARLFGRWCDREGRPAAGQRARAFRLSEEGGSRSQTVAAAEADGSYELYLLPGDYRLRFGDLVAATTLAAGEQKRLDVRPGPGCRVTITVSGHGILKERAVIHLGGASETGLRSVHDGSTEQTGTVVFDRVQPGPAEVYAEVHLADETASIQVVERIQIPETGALDVDVEVPENCLRLTVVAGSPPRPVAGALVELWAEGKRSPRRRLSTDPLGVATFTHLATGGVRLLASARSSAPTAATAEVGAGTTLSEMRLNPGADVRLVARYADSGDPMPTVVKVHVPEDAQPPRWWRCVTDREGKGILEDIPAEQTHMEFLVDACEPVDMTVDPAALAGRPLELRFKRMIVQ